MLEIIWLVFTTVLGGCISHFGLDVTFWIGAMLGFFVGGFLIIAVKLGSVDEAIDAIGDIFLALD